MRKDFNLISLMFFGAISFFLRYFYILKPGYNFDLSQFLKWQNFVNEKGFWNLYSQENVNLVDKYPPLIPFLSSIWSKIQLSSFDDLKWFKLLPTAFEVILIVISIFIILKSSAKYKNILAGVVAVSPAIGFITSAWGQAESIFCLLILLSFVLLSRFEYLSVIALLAAVLTKPQALPAVMIFFLFCFFSKHLKKTAILLAEFLLLSGLILVLFKIKGNLNILDLYTGSVGFYKNLSLNAFNLWWFIYKNHSWDIADTVSNGLSYKSAGLLLFAVFELPAIFYLAKAKKISEVMLVLAYTYLCFFVFPTEIHERYLYPAVAFWGIAAVLDKRLFYGFLILNFTLLANNFAVMQSVYPQFGFLQTNLLTGDWTVFVSAANILVCLYTAMILLFKGYEKK